MKTKSHLIKETPQYQGTTSQIVKDIFKVIKQNITEEEQKTYYLPEELDLDKPFYDAAYGSGVTVELTIKRDTQMTEPFLVDALYVPEEEIIEIVIQLNPFEEPKSYAPLYQYLMEYVRHELEHFDQEYKGTLPATEEGLSTMEYYSQPHEVEAQGAGLNLKAKKTRQGYEKVVGDSIELTKQRYGLSDEEGNDLYNLIVGDIEERYGKKELNEQLESGEGKERLATAMKKHFNSPSFLPEGICEIKVRVSDITPVTEPIRLTLVFDKDKWLTKGLEDSITGRIHHTRRYKIDTIRKSVTDEAKRLFSIQLWDIGVSFADCDDLSVLYEQQNLVDLQDDKSFTPRGHTVIDNDEFKVWAALDEKSFCEFAKGTQWCEKKGTYPTNDMWNRMYGAGRGGTYYFVKDKKTGVLNLVSDYSKIPLLREGDVRQVFNTDGIPMDKFAFFSQKPELRKLLDVRYTLQQRIKYEMPFTSEEQDNWYEKNTTPLSTVVYALAQGKDVEKNMVLLEDFIGEELTISDDSHYRPSSSSVRNYIDITKEGIVLYMEEETYIHNVLCISEDDDWYYNRAFDDYGDDYEEMDSDELNYMSCWFDGEVMQRVYALRAKLGADEKTTCSEFDDGQFTEFFEQHFPKMWDSTTDDLLNHLGYGIGESRRLQMREFLDSEIIIPATPEGRGEVSVFISYVQLLFHITTHEITTLSTLLSDQSCVGEIDGGLSDIWYDSYDWPDRTNEEMNDTMNEFLDEVDKSDISIEERQSGMEKFKKTMNDLNFRTNASDREGSYRFVQPWVESEGGGNTIRVRHYNVEDDTVDLFINTPTTPYRNIPINVPLEELVEFTQPTLFGSEWEKKIKKYVRGY